jgi:hypothetical protein
MTPMEPMERLCSEKRCFSSRGYVGRAARRREKSEQKKSEQKKSEQKKKPLNMLKSITQFEIFMDTHPHFPRHGPVCHINSCKALEFFKKNKVKAKLVHFDPNRLDEVTYGGLAPNHVWVEVVGIGYYDALHQKFHNYDSHPYGDKDLFEEPECDKLSQIFPRHFIRAWNRKKGEKIDWKD